MHSSDNLLTGGMLEKFDSSMTLYEFLNPKLFPLQFSEIKKDIYCKAIKEGKSFSIIRGDIKTAEFDYDFSGMEDRGNKAKSHIPKITLRSLLDVGKGFDYIFIDMSPNLGPLNKTLLMCSSYFIVPTSPTFFCHQAIDNLRSILVKWNDDFSIFRKSQYNPDGIVAKPKFLGIVSQNFRPREANRSKENAEGMAHAFNQWHTGIKEKVNLLAEGLIDYNMSVHKTQFEELFTGKSPYLITDVSDLNQLGPLSEELGKPSFAFSKAELTFNGLNQKHYKDQIDELKISLRTITDGLIKLL